MMNLITIRRFGKACKCSANVIGGARDFCYLGKPIITPKNTDSASSGSLWYMYVGVRIMATMLPI